MPLSWNEIKTRATEFSKEWEDTTSEEAEAKSFLEAFFNIFGISRKKVASFEHKVAKLNKQDGYIDLLWMGKLLVEMKSAGKSLDKAYVQAKEYLQNLEQDNIPQYILLCDFQTFRLIDIVEETEVKFSLKDLVKNVQHFAFIAGYQKRSYKEQDPVNITAALLMGELHDELKAIGYSGHELEVYLVRLLFCLFADDTTIFDYETFTDYIEQRTNDDGSDLAAKLSELFYILNKPKEKRLKNIDEQLNAFPYVNGKLFEEQLSPASFDKRMRDVLLKCCHLDWGKISPAIFGSMFQSVMDAIERRNLGAHYTSEKNILKLIKPLFLDELWAEFGKVKGNRNKLVDFHKKLASLRFLDPACGCGNFLVITYRELRLLEIEVLRGLRKNEQGLLNIGDILLLDVDMMYGIELEEFPAQIAQVAMWLIDHQMNMLISQQFGQYFARLPLKKAATIINGNALIIDWESIIPKSTLSYMLGNPPFIGSRKMDKMQKQDLTDVFDEIKDVGELDYVTGWYIKAAKYIQGTNIKVGFVSTNSIVQGLQTGIIWEILLNKYKIKIHFAHRTFKWRNEASGNANIYCVIIGFANYDTTDKLIYDYDDINGEPHEVKVKNINPYLIDADDIFIKTRSTPISNIPEMNFGNMPADGGQFLFTTEEKDEFLRKEPEAEKYFKPFLSAREFISNKERWCLWLEKIDPSDLRSLKLIKERVEKVKAIRSISSRPKLAEIPHLFAQITQPKNKDFILIPRHSSENRNYIPISLFNSKNIAADSCLIVPNGTLYHFGILTSKMHMAWVKYVCGRIKSDFRYSKDIVYNNYPFPFSPDDKKIKAIELAAQDVLNARDLYPNSSLADLYDTSSMPTELVKAHNNLNKVVDLAYRSQPFPSDAKRMEYLFDLYGTYCAELFKTEKKPKKKTSKNES